MSENKYIHLRLADSSYSRSAYGGVTVGFKTDVEKQCIVYTFARVHPKDRYNKKTGRQLVDDRLAAGLTDCHMLPLDAVLEESGLKNRLNTLGLAKLRIEDFGWKIIVRAISRKVQDTVDATETVDFYI